MSQKEVAATGTNGAATRKSNDDAASLPAWTWPVYSPESIARRKWTTNDLAHWYERGVQDGRYLGAAAQAEVASAGTSVDTGMKALFEQRRARAALFRERAVLLAASMGKVYVDHPGGPVDWETGRPLRRQHLRVVAA